MLEAWRKARFGVWEAQRIEEGKGVEIKDLFDEWLRANRPDRAEKVLSLIRQMRGGALYQAEFGTRMKGEGPIAQLLAALVHAHAPAALRQCAGSRKSGKSGAYDFGVPLVHWRQIIIMAPSYCTNWLVKSSSTGVFFWMMPLAR